MQSNKTFLAILVLSLSKPGLANELDISVDQYQEFKQGIRKSEEEIDYRKNLLNHMEIDQLVPGLDEKLSKQDKRSNTDSKQSNNQVSSSSQNSSDKKNTKSNDPNNIGSSSTRNHDASGDQRRSRPEQKTTDTRDQAQARKLRSQSKYEQKRAKFSQSISNETRFLDLEKVVKFGIPIGTEIKVRLIKGASNALGSNTPMIVEEDVIGDFKVLSRGSTLFGTADTLVGSPRLFIQLRQGITKYDREEFSITGSIYAMDGNAGLEADVISDGRTLARAGNTASEQIASGLIGLVPQDNVLVNAGKRATKNIITEHSDEQEVKTGNPAYILQSQPQRATLIVEETF